MKSMNELYSEIQKNIDVEFYNSRLIKNISTEFLSKGLDPKIANYLYSGNYEISELSKNELIGICEVLYEEGFEIFKPQNFFTDSDLLNYKIMINENNEFLDRLVFKNAIKCDDRNTFLAPFVPAKDIYDFVKSHLIRYNFNTQRNAKVKTINNSTVIKEINLNRKSVKEIKNLFLSGKAAVTTIYFNMLTMPNKEPIINYDENKRILTIVPDPSLESNKTLFLDSIDGWHRTQGIVEAYEEALEKGIELNAYLNVQIENYSIEEARDFIYQTEKRNKINEDYTQSLKNDDFSKTARIIASTEKDNVLYGKVGSEWNEMNVKKLYTTNAILATSLRESGLSQNLFKQKHQTDRLITMIGLITDMISEYKFNGEKDEFFDSEFNKPWSWGMYINLCFRFIDKDEYFDELYKSIKILTEKNIVELKLGQKNASMRKIKAFIDEVISEV